MKQFKLKLKDRTEKNVTRFNTDLHTFITSYISNYTPTMINAVTNNIEGFKAVPTDNKKSKLIEYIYTRLMFTNEQEIKQHFIIWTSLNQSDRLKQYPTIKPFNDIKKINTFLSFKKAYLHRYQYQYPKTGEVFLNDDSDKVIFQVLSLYLTKFYNEKDFSNLENLDVISGFLSDEIILGIISSKSYESENKKLTMLNNKESKDFYFESVLNNLTYKINAQSHRVKIK